MRVTLLLCCFTFSFAAAIGGLCNCVRAQGAISGFPTPKGEVAIAASYGVDRYDSYFLPDGQVETRNITTTSYSLFVEAGVSDNLALVATLPWMQVNEGEGSLQDAALWMKYLNSDKRGGRHARRFFTAIGLSLPVGDYVGEGPEAIGQRAGVFQSRLTYQIQHDAGWFVSAQTGVDFQFVPVAAASWPVVLRTGYGNKFFYAEGWWELVTSLEGGADVTGAGAGTGSGWRRVGLTGYVPITRWLGLVGGGAWVLSGTAIGDSSRLNTGVVFKLGTGRNKR